MSLNWDLTKCDRIPRVWDEEQQKDIISDEDWVIVERTIWRMMATGLGWELTDANAALFFARSRLYANIVGDDHLTVEQVHMMVGLRVNISPETDKQWRKRIMEYQQTNYIRQYNEAAAKLGEAE